MKYSTKSFFVFLILVLCAGLTYAQPGRGLSRSNLTKLYDTSTVDTIKGKITKVDTSQTEYGRFPGLLLSIKDNEETTKVYLAPIWYLSQQSLTFKKEDEITIIGSRVKFNSKPIVITQKFKYKGSETKIRDENGFPVWAGKRMGPGKGR